MVQLRRRTATNATGPPASSVATPSGPGRPNPMVAAKNVVAAANVNELASVEIADYLAAHPSVPNPEVLLQIGSSLSVSASTIKENVGPAVGADHTSRGTAKAGRYVAALELADLKREKREDGLRAKVADGASRKRPTHESSGPLKELTNTLSSQLRAKPSPAEHTQQKRARTASSAGPKPKPKPKLPQPTEPGCRVEKWYPDPKDGEMYGAEEAARILQPDNLPKGKGKMTLTIQDWITRGWIPVVERSMARRVKAMRDGKQVAGWGDRGRRRDMSDKDISRAVKQLLSNKPPGYSIKDNEVEQILIRYRKRRRKNEGKSSIGKTKIKPSRNQLLYTKARMLNSAGAKMPIAVEPKTKNRVTSDTSIRTSISHAMSTIASIFMAGVTSGGAVSNSPAAKLMSRAHGGHPVTPVDPALMTSTEDCGFYNTDGMMKDKRPEWMAVVLDAPKTGISSVYSLGSDSTTMFNGVTVKSTITTTADGQVAPFFLTIGGLTEQELCPGLCPSGVLILPVTGLTMDCDPVDGGVGHLCFVRKTAEGTLVGMTPETILHDFYIENVHEPFIAK